MNKISRKLNFEKVGVNNISQKTHIILRNSALIKSKTWQKYYKSKLNKNYYSFYLQKYHKR